MNTVRLAELSALRITAKLDEEQAIKRRREIDAQIVTEMGSATEGTLKQDTNGLAISVSFSLTRKVSHPETLQGSWVDLSPQQQSCFRWKPEVDTRNLKSLQQMNPQEFEQISGFITSTPAAPTVKVETLKAPGA